MNRIITRDILVEKITGLLDNNLPSLEGDKVIQIGSTVHRYGEQECFLKHIVTLDTCNDIDGAVVVPCKTEEEVLKGGFDYVLVLPWHFRPFFLKQQKYDNLPMVFPLPKLEIVNRSTLKNG